MAVPRNDTDGMSRLQVAIPNKVESNGVTRLLARFE
jgi:hypothetical protein